MIGAVIVMRNSQVSLMTSSWQSC